VTKDEALTKALHTEAFNKEMQQAYH
jgi:hypothetical protein